MKIHERNRPLPKFVPGQQFTMYGEVWEYLGKHDWVRVAEVEGSDTIDNMDDDEMRGQRFEYTLNPDATPTVKTVQITRYGKTRYETVPIDYEEDSE